MPQPIRQHKLLAIGKALPSGSFGADALSSYSAGTNSDQGNRKTLADKNRGVGKAIKGSQADADHGPQSY